MKSQLEQPTLTPSQAARVLALSSERVRQLIRAGKLPAIMTPLGRLIPADAVEILRQEREAKNAA